jgi:hypothetical protein
LTVKTSNMFGGSAKYWKGVWYVLTNLCFKQVHRKSLKWIWRTNLIASTHFYTCFVLSANQFYIQRQSMYSVFWC